MSIRFKTGACSLLIVAVSMLAACTSVSPTAATPTLLPSQAPSPSPTATATLAPTATRTPTASPTPLPPTIPPTPPDLGIFLPPKLPFGVQPQPYISSTCQYLKARWDPAASLPGTIVVPVMFHSIALPDRTITDDTTISADTFARFMEKAHQLGFQT